MDDRAPSSQAHAGVPAAPSLPSTGLAIACTLHALPLGWAAFMLPVGVTSWLTLTLGLLALLHAAVATLVVLRQPRLLAWTWLTLSVYSLLLLGTVTIVAASAATYLSELYQEIGVAVSAGLAIFWGLLVLLTVPISAWGLAYTWRAAWLPRRRAVVAAALALLAMQVASTELRSAARAEPVRGADAPLLHDALQRATASATASARVAASLLQPAPLECAQAISTDALTLLVTGLSPNGQPFSACLQAPTSDALVAAFTRTLAERQAPGTPLKLDLVRGVQKIARVHPLFDALSLRPVLDGVCSEHACFAPWQLATFDAFTRFHPLPVAVPDAAFGVSLEELAASLHAAEPKTAPLWRIETESLLAHAGQLTPYARTRPEQLATDLPALQRGVALAGQHIVRAQRPDGGFRYLLDPYHGQSHDRLNLPRQAGTTLAVCELVPSSEGRDAAARALGQLRSFEKQSGELSAISETQPIAELGPTALPLIAFASCRPRIGPEHDVLIGRLARFLLRMQRENGSFSPEFDLNLGHPVGNYEPLYAGGQAVFALTLVEQLAKAEPKPELPSADALHAAVERAMNFYAHAYWPRALRSLFYIEENWHCLAARAALTSHRHDDYERFCLDYVAFKSRLILEPDDGVSPEHLGGYGLSDMFPPHCTATAGFGEALAAAMAVKRARGMDLDEDKMRMRMALGFVLRQQWTADNCFACANGAEAVGGFSESEASSVIRIDYVQHAMAALGHGSEMLAQASH